MNDQKLILDKMEKIIETDEFIQIDVNKHDLFFDFDHQYY